MFLRHAGQWEYYSLGALQPASRVYGATVALVDGIREALRPEYEDEDDADGLLYDMTDPNNPLGLRSFDLYITGIVLFLVILARVAVIAKMFGLEP